MRSATEFSHEVLLLDIDSVIRQLSQAIRETVLQRLRRFGVVVGLSGGVDSSVTAALCVKALSKERVFGVFMPEEDSSEDSLSLGRQLAERLGIATAVEDIAPALRALGCYSRRDEAIRKVIPEYGAGWKSKIVLPDLLAGPYYSLYSVVAQSPAGTPYKARLTKEAYLGVVAATNFKQRTRKMVEYYHADRLWYSVAGTPNRLEYTQGFFVKNGDGAADFKPIAHLYKTQVYQLGRYLGVPEEILHRPPTTDTYSLEQSQEEFFFSVPLETLDLCLYGRNHDIDPAEVAKAVNLSEEQVRRVYANIDSKLASTRYLHVPPCLMQTVEEVGSVDVV
jgi:NAD+ synthase